MSLLVKKPESALAELVNSYKPPLTAGHAFSISTQTISETKLDVLYEDYTFTPVFDCKIPMDNPVFVEVVDGEEHLIYHTSKMDLGKLYQVKWKNEHYALRKTEHDVEIFRFYPEGK